jgi:hypothetical protein
MTLEAVVELTLTHELGHHITDWATWQWRSSRRGCYEHTRADNVRSSSFGVQREKRGEMSTNTARRDAQPSRGAPPGRHFMGLANLGTEGTFFAAMSVALQGAAAPANSQRLQCSRRGRARR